MRWLITCSGSLVWIVVLTCYYNTSSGQGMDGKSYFYLDLNNADKTKIVTVTSDHLSLQYYDVYGKNQNLPLKIYNWKKEVVADLLLQKTMGLNYFNIDLATIPDVTDGKVRSCLVIDEGGTVHELVFRYQAPEKKDLSVAIFVNPKLIHCDDPLLGNYVEFYGSVSNGNAPYTVDWYVMNATRTDYLYQPKTQTMDRPGSSAVIAVDISPDYYVIMVVHDACGNEQYQVSQITCKQGKKKINTVFFENIDQVKNLVRKIN